MTVSHHSLLLPLQHSLVRQAQEGVEGADSGSQPCSTPSKLCHNIICAPVCPAYYVLVSLCCTLRPPSYIMAIGMHMGCVSGHTLIIMRTRAIDKAVQPVFLYSAWALFV